MDKANELYNELVSSFPDSEFATMAERNIANANTVSVPQSGEDEETNTEDNVVSD